MEKFKVSDKYLDKLCDIMWKVSTFFVSTKHHPKLDLSNLDMEGVEKETLADRQPTREVGEGGEATTSDEAVNANLSSFTLP